MSKFYILAPDGTPTAICGARIPGMNCTEATPELDAAWAARPVETPPVVPVPYAVSKVRLRLALRNGGMENLLDGYLSANPAAAKLYDDATMLMSDDPFFTAAIPQVCASAGLTEEQAWAIIEGCKPEDLV